MSGVIKFQTYLRLGLPNLARVALYRVGLRTGLHPAVGLTHQLKGKNFYRPPQVGRSPLVPPSAWQTSGLYFGWQGVPLAGDTPAWHRDPLLGRSAVGADQPWWQLPDFGSPGDDIKAVWEPSRFDWALAMAQRAATGDEADLVRLNAWIADWCLENPAYLGANWKCGQEASIRVMHLALAARLLGQETRPSADLADLLAAHLARIAPTLSYAMAQDNNHGTSEAAALFIGGSFCEQAGVKQAGKWAETGRHWLENRARRLIAPDGSFSQYSLNYHRVLVDTLCLVELWRRWEQLPAFSDVFRERGQAAAEWMFQMVEPSSGDGPNVGENDGANLLPLCGADYRDYRPTVQLAMALFADQLAYATAGPHQDQLDWLDVKRPTITAGEPGTRNFPDGGYAVLRRGSWQAMLKYPHYQFRPHHCDALHLDLWHDGHNLLRDAGTYSYNAESPWREYFSGTSAHNTVTFDGRDQMPSVSRFLRGAWLKATNIEYEADEPGAAVIAAGYSDWQGAHHRRRVRVSDAQVVVEDQVRGFARSAVMRWRLQPGDWSVNGLTLQGENFRIQVSADVEIIRMELVEGWESRYYLQKSELPVLEVEVHEPGHLTSVITYDKSL